MAEYTRNKRHQYDQPSSSSSTHIGRAQPAQYGRAEPLSPRNAAGGTATAAGSSFTANSDARQPKLQSVAVEQPLPAMATISDGPQASSQPVTLDAAMSAPVTVPVSVAVPLPASAPAPSLTPVAGSGLALPASAPTPAPTLHQADSSSEFDKIHKALKSNKHAIERVEKSVSTLDEKHHDTERRIERGLSAVEDKQTQLNEKFDRNLREVPQSLLETISYQEKRLASVEGSLKELHIKMDRILSHLPTATSAAGSIAVHPAQEPYGTTPDSSVGRAKTATHTVYCVRHNFASGSCPRFEQDLEAKINVLFAAEKKSSYWPFGTSYSCRVVPVKDRASLSQIEPNSILLYIVLPPGLRVDEQTERELNELGQQHRVLTKLAILRYGDNEHVQWVQIPPALQNRVVQFAFNSRGLVDLDATKKSIETLYSDLRQK